MLIRHGHCCGINIVTDTTIFLISILQVRLLFSYFSLSLILDQQMPYFDIDLITPEVLLDKPDILLHKAGSDSESMFMSLTPDDSRTQGFHPRCRCVWW